jgi:hypothetical protein
VRRAWTPLPAQLLETPIYIAALCGFGESVAHMLAAAGPRGALLAAHRYHDGWTPLHAACLKGVADIVRPPLFLQTPETLLRVWTVLLLQRDSCGATRRAGRGLSRAQVRALLDEGFDPNAPTKFGQTALHVCARQGSRDVAALLMCGGASAGLFDTVRAAPGRLSAISVFLLKSILYGAFVWARRALNGPKRRLPARAGRAAPFSHRRGAGARRPRGGA